MDYVETRNYLTTRVAELDAIWEKMAPRYREIQLYMNPDAGVNLSGYNSEDYYGTGVGYDEILDPTPLEVIMVCAAGIQSGTTSPARPWFVLQAEDPIANRNPQFKNFLFEFTERMRTLFARTNVYHGFYHTYKELATFDTGAVALFEHLRKGLHARPFTCGEYRLALNSDLEIDTFLYKAFFSARQLVEKFGKENCSNVVLQAYDTKKPESLFKVCWLVEPNDGRLKEKDFMNRKFRAIYFEQESTEDKILDISGFDSFPVMAPRWDIIAGRVYGSGIGAQAVPNSKGLQRIKESSLIALDKQVEPPLTGPTNLSPYEINSMPNGYTPADDMSGRGLRAVYENKVNLADVRLEIEDARMQMRRGHFNDLFMMLMNISDTTMRTKEEIVKRHEEKLIMLGPFIERQHTELLNPFISRAAQIMIELGMAPKVPKGFEKAAIQIVHISILAQAQKMIGSAGMNEWLSFVGNLSAVFPEAKYKVSPFAAIDRYADMTGVAPDVVVPNEIAAAAFQDDLKKQQAAQQGAAMAQGVESAKLLSETDINKDSALKALIGR